jgi:hypothetical protein
MRRRAVAVGMVVALGLTATCQVAWTRPAQSSKVDDTVMNLVQTRPNAEPQGDSAGLDKFIADDFMGTRPGGSILNKRDIVPPAGEERPRMPKSQVKDSLVRLYGNAAVVMGSAAYETLDQPGFRFTLVFPSRGARLADGCHAPSRRATRKVSSTSSVKLLEG